jgi:hypothetical protein
LSILVIEAGADDRNDPTIEHPPFCFVRTSDLCCSLLFPGYFGSRACSRDSILTPE